MGIGNYAIGTSSDMQGFLDMDTGL